MKKWLFFGAQEGWAGGFSCKRGGWVRGGENSPPGTSPNWGKFENWTLYNAVEWPKIQLFCQFVSFFEVKCADRSTMWMRPNFVFSERRCFKLSFELLSVGIVRIFENAIYYCPGLQTQIWNA